MARSLTFTFGKTSFDCTLHKVDRSKLYGSRSIETLDMDGNKCTLATLLDDGKTLLPYGGTASGYINPDGEWVCRKDIKAVDFNGKPLKKVPSSFDTGISLHEKVTVEEFLNHSIRLSYALTSKDEENGMHKAFIKSMKKGDIYKTSFSYRGSIDPDPAFVMQGEDETIWLLIASRNEIEFSALEQAGVIAATEEQDEGAESSADELDFGML